MASSQFLIQIATLSNTPNRKLNDLSHCIVSYFGRIQNYLEMVGNQSEFLDAFYRGHATYQMWA